MKTTTKKTKDEPNAIHFYPPDDMFEWLVARMRANDDSMSKTVQRIVREAMREEGGISDKDRANAALIVKAVNAALANLLGAIDMMDNPRTDLPEVLTRHIPQARAALALAEGGQS